MVTDLLTATGSGKPVENGNSEAAYNGAANFLLANHSDNGSLAAARSRDHDITLQQPMQASGALELPRHRRS